MTNTSIRAGGLAVPSGDYVSVDGTTIQGNGTARDPIRVVSAPPVPTAVQRATATNVQHGEINATDGLTVCSTSGAGLKQFDLEDADEDGFQKTIALVPNANGGASFRVNATFVSGGAFYQHFNFPNTGGGLIVVWDDSNACWLAIATLGGTPG